MTIDAAHVLFQNDAPKLKPQAPAPATAFQSGGAGEPAPPAGNPADAAKPDDAAILFKDDAVDLGAKAVTEILDGFSNSAIGDGDGGERARAIEAARDGLLADAKAHGTDTADLAEAMAVVKERQADSLVEPTPEVAGQRMAEALEACRAENISDADLSLARRLIADIEKVAPGTIYSLERSGAGNEIRLIRKAVAEARRRYGG